MQVIATFTLDCASLKLRHYLCIGWGFPVVIVTMWASLIYATADKATSTVENIDRDVTIQVANGTANAVRRETITVTPNAVVLMIYHRPTASLRDIGTCTYIDDWRSYKINKSKDKTFPRNGDV